MARICPLCDKGPITVTKRKKLRGHYNPTTKKRKSPNLQWARLPADVAADLGMKPGTRIKICTRCLRNLHKTRSA